jgi:hypothetical protein
MKKSKNAGCCQIILPGNTCKHDMNGNIVLLVIVVTSFDGAGPVQLLQQKQTG